VKRALFIALLSAACGGTPCQPGGDGTYVTALYGSLDQYCMVSIENGQVVPHDGVTAYDLNTPLFSDSAVKLRTVWLPKGATATYTASGVLDFPVGTVFTKSFGFRDDLRKATPAIHWVETRVYAHQTAGWSGVSYKWDDAQARAAINSGGGVQPQTWIDETGASVTAQYLVPNGNQCSECHSKGSAQTPIGPKARNLNKSFHYAAGDDNQLSHWASAGILAGAPADPSQAPKLPVWNDASTGTPDQRARAYLEGNCAHCHNAEGFARTTGLYLDYDQTSASALGVCKPPVAVGEATGGFLYDVVPGDPDHSIMPFRLASVEPAVMMPQIGRSIVDPVGVQLVRDWIAALPGSCH